MMADQLPTPLTYGRLTAYPRPPVFNGTEHYDVEVPNPGFPTDFTAGRLTRRPSPHNERPTPGWYVWCAWPGVAGYILRDQGNNVLYYPDPTAALAVLHDVIFPHPDTEPQVPGTMPLICPCECNRNPKEFCGGCGHAGCGRR